MIWRLLIRRTLSVRLYSIIQWDAMCSLLNIHYFQASICTLYPPHYDAVSSLAAHKDLLFSSCGVTIKQWDIKERSLKHVSIHV